MELWLDGVDFELTAHLKELNLLHGITTNPTLLAKTGRAAEDVLERLFTLFSGPIAVQVTLRKVFEMIDQAKDLHDFSSRIIVKIPVTEEGIEAISRLSHLEIPTMGTAVFTPMQAVLAAKAGARYVAPYFRHIGEKAFDVIQSIQEMFALNGFRTKQVVAALETLEQVEECLARGIGCLTLKPSLFKECLAPPAQTLEHLDRFDADWSEAAPSKLLVSRQFI